MRAEETFGGFFKKKRQELGLTLRRFCLHNELDPGNISKLERGRLGPPIQDDVLGRYAKALGIKKGSEEWRKFRELAAIGAGRIPPEFLEDRELVKKLPVVFRLTRDRKIDRERLERLIQMIKRA